jgi:hypothetical protein
MSTFKKKERGRDFWGAEDMKTFMDSVLVAKMGVRKPASSLIYQIIRFKTEFLK